jgi:hypothetical protein
MLSSANIHSLIDNVNFIAKAINEKGEQNTEYLQRIEKLERQARSFEKLE